MFSYPRPNKKLPGLFTCVVLFAWSNIVKWQDIGKDSFRLILNPCHVTKECDNFTEKSWSGKKFCTSNKCKNCHGQQKQKEFIAITQMIPKVNLYTKTKKFYKKKNVEWMQNSFTDFYCSKLEDFWYIIQEIHHQFSYFTRRI